jgi:hypothetical protein
MLSEQRKKNQKGMFGEGVSIKESFHNHTRSLRLHGGYPKSRTTRFDPSVAESFTSYSNEVQIENTKQF